MTTEHTNEESRSERLPIVYLTPESALELLAPDEKRDLHRHIRGGGVTSIYRDPNDNSIWVHVERQGPTSGDYQKGSFVIHSAIELE